MSVARKKYAKTQERILKSMRIIDPPTHCDMHDGIPINCHSHAARTGLRDAVWWAQCTYYLLPATVREPVGFLTTVICLNNVS